ncbi:MFS transporter [Demequina sp. NBRC 110056]|uniref:MFS transporter n=1 Tax=Demequina sp. NBRC 110056 TaxID=1570345 RepID=UPI00118038FA|nr:glycoside-pentoside-hexuronide (GPH):cation symporter [Demequina sp. NBRC 110056]
MDHLHLLPPFLKHESASKMSTQTEPTTDASHTTGSAIAPVRLKEKLAYGVGDMGQSLVTSTVAAFALFYFTNVAGIGAAIAGTILLIGQLLNGVTDFVIGVLIDKTSTRWGKLRPWILFTAIPMGAVYVGIFTVPTGLNDTGKVVWSIIMYSLLMAVFYTAANVAYGALVSVISADTKTRVSLSTFRFFASILTSLVASTATLPLVEALGNDQAAWTSTAGIYAVIAVTTALVVFTGTRERVVTNDSSRVGPKVPARTMLRTLFRNRYFLWATVLFIMVNGLNGFIAAGAVYFANDVLGDATLYGLLAIASLLPTVAGIPLMPTLMGKFGRRPVMFVGFGLTVFGTAVVAIAPDSLPVLLVGLAIRGLGLVPFAVGSMPLLAEIADYGEWKYGLRLEGLTFSVSSLGFKIGTGLSAAVVGWLLAWGGYDAAASTQGESARLAITAAYVYLPLVAGVLAIVVFLFLNVDRHRPQVEAHLEATSAASPAAHA